MRGQTRLLGTFADALPGGHAGRGRDPGAVQCGRTTYYSKELEALSTVGIYGGSGGAAGCGMTAAGTQRDG